MSVLRNTSITLASRYVANAAKAGTGLVVATTLGASGAGIFALMRIWPHMAAALLGGGMSISIPYFVGSKRHPTNVVTEMVTMVGLLMGVVAYIAWIAAMGVLAPKFNGLVSTGGFLLVGLAIPLLLIRNNLNSVQQGQQTFKAANLALCVEEFVELILVLPLFWVGDTHAGTVLVTAAVGSSAASALATAVMLWRRGLTPRPRLHRAIAIEAFTFGLKGHIGRVANMLNWRLDVLILSAMTSVEIVGYYAVASQAAELFRPLSASLTYVLRPLIAGLSIAAARVRGVFLYRRVFLINLVMVALMAVGGGPAIVLLFGEEFRVAIPAFQILLIGLAAHGADGVLAGYNVGIGRPELNTYAALIGLVVTVAGDLLLIPTHGLVGAAVASSVAYTVKAIALTTIFLSLSGVTLGQLAGVKEYSPHAA